MPALRQAGVSFNSLSKIRILMPRLKLSSQSLGEETLFQAGEQAAIVAEVGWNPGLCEPTRVPESGRSKTHIPVAGPETSKEARQGFKAPPGFL